MLHYFNRQKVHERLQQLTKAAEAAFEAAVAALFPQSTTRLCFTVLSYTPASKIIVKRPKISRLSVASKNLNLKKKNHFADYAGERAQKPGIGLKRLRLKKRECGEA